MHFEAIWWQLFVGRQTRYICNFAIKIEPNCQLKCAHDCAVLFFITIVTIVIIFIYVASTSPWNPGHLASRGWSCRDAGQHGTDPGQPGKSGTGGNPTSARWHHSCFTCYKYCIAIVLQCGYDVYGMHVYIVNIMIASVFQFVHHISHPVVYWVYAGIRRIPTSGFLTAYTHLSDHK